MYYKGKNFVFAYSVGRIWYAWLWTKFVFDTRKKYVAYANITPLRNKVYVLVPWLIAGYLTAFYTFMYLYKLFLILTYFLAWDWVGTMKMLILFKNETFLTLCLVNVYVIIKAVKYSANTFKCSPNHLMLNTFT